jgi:hypothetical protein
MGLGGFKADSRMSKRRRLEGSGLRGHMARSIVSVPQRYQKTGEGPRRCYPLWCHECLGDEAVTNFRVGQCSGLEPWSAATQTHPRSLLWDV